MVTPAGCFSLALLALTSASLACHSNSTCHGFMDDSEARLGEMKPQRLPLRNGCLNALSQIWRWPCLLKGVPAVQCILTVSRTVWGPEAEDRTSEDVCYFPRTSPWQPVWMVDDAIRGGRGS